MTAKPRSKAKPPAAAGPVQTGPLFIDFALYENSAPRHMAVQVPSAEQLAVWQSIGETFTRLGDEWAHQRSVVSELPADHPDVVDMRARHNRQAVRGVNRSIKLVKSVLAEDKDREWVDDMVMEGATIEQMLRIVTLAVDAMRQRGRTPAATPATAPKAELAE